MHQNGDLSVEEILESIKRVIARDNKEIATVERHRRETEGVVLRGPASNFGLAPRSRTGIDDEFDRDGAVHREDETEPLGSDSEVLDLKDAATELPETDSLDGEASVQAGPVDSAGNKDADTHLANDGPPESKTIEPLAEDVLDTASADIPACDFVTPNASFDTSPTPTATVSEPQSKRPEGETPLAQMVRESLRPMIREWLDENLPPLVERMVRSELERIIGKSY